MHDTGKKLFERDSLPCARNTIDLSWKSEKGAEKTASLTDGSIVENAALVRLLAHQRFSHLALVPGPRRAESIHVDFVTTIRPEPTTPFGLRRALREFADETVTLIEQDRPAQLTIGLNGAPSEARPETFFSDRDAIVLRYERWIAGRWVPGMTQATLGSRDENLALAAVLADPRCAYLADIAFERRTTHIDPGQATASLHDHCAGSSDRVESVIREFRATLIRLASETYRNIEIGPFSL